MLFINKSPLFIFRLLLQELLYPYNYLSNTIIKQFDNSHSTRSSLHVRMYNVIIYREAAALLISINQYNLRLYHLHHDVSIIYSGLVLDKIEQKRKLGKQIDRNRYIYKKREKQRKYTRKKRGKEKKLFLSTFSYFRAHCAQ